MHFYSRYSVFKQLLQRFCLLSRCLYEILNNFKAFVENQMKGSININNNNNNNINNN
jgi:hypothetical protein